MCLLRRGLGGRQTIVRTRNSANRLAGLRAHFWACPHFIGILRPRPKEILPTVDQPTSSRAVPLTPEWINERRKSAGEIYDKLAMPSEKEEAWRYVELDFDLDDFAPAPSPGPPMASSDGTIGALTSGGGRAVIIDGHTVSAVGDGISFGPLADGLDSHGDLLRTVADKGVPIDLDKFSAANYAFGTDGVFLHVASGQAVSEPILVDIQTVTGGTASYPRIEIAVDDNAEATVVIAYRSPDEMRSVLVPHIDAIVGDNARLRIGVVQDVSYETVVVAQARITVGRDASVTLSEVGLGADLGRLHLTVDLIGRGAHATVLGAYFGEGDQTLDYRYYMNHVGENTTSEMFLKGAVEDEALSVFTGMIRIEEGAQKTNAHQTNRNLILSDGAAAQSVPNLEILANDVRCGHGSTMGPLDAEQRYYLMSRGLDRKQADRLQVRGFFEAVIGRMPDVVASSVRDRINRKFVDAQLEGRV